MDEESAVRVQRLELEQFRVYHGLQIDIPPTGMRIAGPNGSGKSSILEAIELLATTRPRRGANDADLIAHESGIELGVQPYARVVGAVDRGGTAVRIEMFIQRLERRGGSKKLLRVADRPRRAADVVGLVPTVTFAPDDLDLVIGSPSVRRRFVDVLLSQIDRRYLRVLSRFAKILAQRNGLLRQVATAGGDGADEFQYWDEQLVALGSYIAAARARLVAALNAEAARVFAELSPDIGDLRVGYQSSIALPDASWDAIAQEATDVTDAAQRIGSVYEQQLRRSRSADLGRGVTTIGPHRDDLTFQMANRELARFGSRGQQRVAVLAVKLSEIAVATTALSMTPVLLLDDVLSELDASHQAQLLATVRRGGGQVFVTATSRDALQAPELADLAEFELSAPGIVGVPPSGLAKLVPRAL